MSSLTKSAAIQLMSGDDIFKRWSEIIPRHPMKQTHNWRGVLPFQAGSGLACARLSGGAKRLCALACHAACLWQSVFINRYMEYQVPSQVHGFQPRLDAIEKCSLGRTGSGGGGGCGCGGSEGGRGEGKKNYTGVYQCCAAFHTS